MRTTIQRLFGLALGLALVFGSVGVASAGVPADEVPATDSGSVSLHANVVGYIQLDLENNNVQFGKVDAFGLGQYNKSTSCTPATSATGGATYGANTPLTATLTSSTPVDVQLDSVGGNFDRFSVILDGAPGDPCGSGVANLSLAGLQNVAPYLPSGFFGPVGQPLFNASADIFFGIQVNTGDGNQDANLSFTLQVQSIA